MDYRKIKKSSRLKAEQDWFLTNEEPPDLSKIEDIQFLVERAKYYQKHFKKHYKINIKRKKGATKPPNFLPISPLPPILFSLILCSLA